MIRRIKKNMSSNKGSKFSSGALIGTFLGATLGLLFAPKTGEQTRKQLKKEGKLETALLYFMDVVYIDANGPSNSGKWGEDFEIMYLPHFAAEIFNITSKLGISEKVLLDKYKSRSEQLKESLKLKKSFEVCWKKFKEETDLDFS